MALLKLLPRRISAHIAGLIAMWTGPRLARHRWMLGNLALIFPDKSHAEIKQLARTSWRNAGYLLSELPRLPELATRLKASRVDHYGIPDALAQGKTTIYVSAHIGNWEVMGRVFVDIGMPCVFLYQPLANPYIDNIVQKQRGVSNDMIRPLPRNNLSRKLIESMEEGFNLIVLLDVRMKQKNSTPVPFFGHNMQAGTLAARLAWRFNCDLVPTFCNRLAPTQLVHQVHSKISLPPKQGTSRSDWILATTKLIYERLEVEIGQHPGSWFCSNRLWDKSLYPHKRQN